MLSFVLSAVMLAAAPEALTEGPVETVAEGLQFSEGPVWLSSGELIFSDIPADAILRVDKSVFRKPSGKSNGLALDKEGRLVACEGGNRRVTRTEKDGTIKVLADSYEGKKFNSPNDLIVRSDGTVFFTDPPYGLEGRAAELDFAGVFSVAPDGTVTLLAKDFNRPNGIALSADEKTLYVADTEAAHVRAFEIGPDDRLAKGRVLFEIPEPDGIKVDGLGRLWCATGDGVRVYQTDGTLVGTVSFPQEPANCAFGGEDGKTLYVTARTGLYRVKCKVGKK